MKRREFIQRSAVAAAGMLALPSLTGYAKGKASIGLQLYTLRSTIGNDPKGHLDKIAGFGYKELETYGYADGKIFGMDFKEFASYAKGLGMQITCGHYPFELATSDKWAAAVADANAVGQKFMVVPSLPRAASDSVQAYKTTCQALNKAGEVCKNKGIRFGYHNHAGEFRDLEGQIPYDVMLAELDPKLVGMEMDIFWVVNAGKDPLRYFEKYPGRFEQWHVKDMDKNDRMRNADVGTGTIDWKAIFAKAKQSGMKHFYVEQESYPGAPIDSTEASIKYLQSIL